jgi:hypothetical protein
VALGPSDAAEADEAPRVVAQMTAAMVTLKIILLA